MYGAVVAEAVVYAMPARYLFSSALLTTFLAASSSSAGIIATKTVTTPLPGVTLWEGKTRAPASTYHVAKIALCTPGVRVGATAPPTAFKTVPAYAQASGAKLAVNGDFFKPGPRVYGVAVGEGKPWPLTKTGADPAVKDQWYYDNFGWIAFRPDGVEFTHTGYVKAHPEEFHATGGLSPDAVTHDIPPGTVALVSGFPELVTEGKQYACSSPTATTCFTDREDMRARNPRSAMGLTQDRRTFILAVVDGRSTSSAGMYGTELAELMAEVGAWQAFNLDGGGSSEMWLSGRGTISKPADGTSRAVANHWGIFTGSGDAAHCVPSADTGEVTAFAGSSAGGPDGVNAAENDSSGGAPDDGMAPNSPDADAGCSAAHGTRHAFGSVGLAIFGLLVLRRRAQRRR
jgi:hypothetical protein